VDFGSHRESRPKSTWSGPTHPCQAKNSRLSRLHLKFIGNQISMVIVVLVATEFQFAILMVFFFPPFGDKRPTPNSPNPIHIKIISK
jgi:hypothetical protein